MCNKLGESDTGCRLCPRECGVNRDKTVGYCHVGSDPVIARAALHFWEEPCISGQNGSGAVFFAGCNMGCVFCQNADISTGAAGRIISGDRLCEIFFELQDAGANNINLVTGDMFLSVIRDSIIKAKSDGLRIPFILNTSSYIHEAELKKMEGLIDIYLADLKYIRDEDALRYSNARNYPRYAKIAIEEMVRQQPECKFDDNGIMQCGVIIRHLLMPGMLIQAKMITEYLYDKYGDNIFISLMNQYTPNGRLEAYPEINRAVSDREYRSLVRYAEGLGITNAYVQEGQTADACYIPAFDLTGVLNNE